MLWGDAQAPAGQAQVPEPCPGASGVMTAVPVVLRMLATGATGSRESHIGVNGHKAVWTGSS